MNTKTLQVLVNHKPIKIIPHNGKFFIEARKNTEFSIKINNNNPFRILANLTIDGLSVLDGKLGGKTDSGYVIPGYGTYEIQGWRISDDKVNNFVFNSKKKSYAASSEETKGDTTNCGVVGLKVFSESVKWESLNNQTYSFKWQDNYPHWKDNWYDTGKPYPKEPIITCNTQRSMSNDLPLKSQSISQSYNCSTIQNCNFINQAQDYDMGTEWGDKEIIDKVTHTTFEKGQLIEEVVIYYASFNSLKAMGVPVINTPKYFAPNPFPSGNFCKPPKKS